MARMKAPSYLRWRLDYDYLRKLSPEQKAWLRRFDREFYEAKFECDAVHPDELRPSCREAFAAAQKDAVTKGSNYAAAALRPLRGKRGQTNRYFRPVDVDELGETLSMETSLVEAMDARNAA